MNIVIYSKPRCPQCDATCRILDQAGVVYQKVDVTLDQQALAYVKSLGYQAAPVVVTGGEHWSGFRPDRLKTLVNAMVLA